MTPKKKVTFSQIWWLVWTSISIMSALTPSINHQVCIRNSASHQSLSSPSTDQLTHSLTMTQGSGSASTPLKICLYLMAVMLCVILFSSTGAQAAGATYLVGGPAGWTFNTDTWPRGKRFAAGDFLIFNYSPKAHNVVAVDKGGYSKCSVSPRAKMFRSGRDKVKLVKGQNYFICSVPGHCDSGMKIAINAM